MLSLTDSQLELLQNTYKSIIWLFDVTDKNNNAYYWSTRDYTYDSTSYTFNIVEFSGISLNRSRSEENIIAPSEVRIKIGNVGNTYSADDFTNGEVLISLIVDDSFIAKWKFNIIKAYGSYQTITLECEDFLQKYLEGAYPNTQLIKALFPDEYYEEEDVCVPVCFGTAYIPLRPVEIEGSRYYLLGPTDRTYTITEVHTPSEWGIKYSWSSSSYSFNQYTKEDQFGNSWQVFQPIIADSNLDGTPDACGLWIEGQRILDMPTQFSYNSITNPADVIKEILKDFGVPENEIDSDSFSDAATTFNNWGLTFNGGLWTKSDRKSILSMLLNSCHSRILVRDKLYLSVLSKTSQKTITTSLVAKESFDYSKLSEELSDSGYVAWQKEGEPQDNMLKALVPGKGTTTDYISDEIIYIPWVQNAVHVQKLACLVFQRKFFKIAELTFEGRSELLTLEPGDVITINGDNYGGTYKAIVDEVEIKNDLTVRITATRHSIEFDDWDDLTQFTDITVYTTVPSAWEALPSGYGYGIRWDREQATLFVEGTIRVTGGFIADSGGFFRSGQTAFDMGTGFWIGNSNGTPRLSIGDSSGVKLTWDGASLNIVGASIKTTSSGARVEIFPTSNIGIVAYDGGDGEVFKIVVGGNDTGDVIIGHYAANQGCKWDRSESTFYVRGKLNADDLVAGIVSMDRIEAGSITGDKIAADSITTEHLQANCVTGTEIAADSITATHIQGDQLDVLATKTGTLTVDEAIYSTNKTSYSDTTAGFWLGNDGGTYKVNIGNDTKYLKWDGSDLEIRGMGHFGDDNDYILVGVSSPGYDHISFYSGGSCRGYIWGSTNGLNIGTLSGLNVRLIDSTGAISLIVKTDRIEFRHPPYPTVDNNLDLGASGFYWKNGYITTIYTDLLRPKASTSDIGDSDNYWENAYISTIYTDLLKPKTSASDIGESSNAWHFAYLSTLHVTNIRVLSVTGTDSNIGASDSRFDNIYVSTVNYCNTNDYCSLVDLSEILSKPACDLLFDLRTDDFTVQAGKHIAHNSWPRFVRNLHYVEVAEDEKDKLEEIAKLVSRKVGEIEKDSKKYFTFEISSVNADLIDSIILAALKELILKIKELEGKIKLRS